MHRDWGIGHHAFVFISTHTGRKVTQFGPVTPPYVLRGLCHRSPGSRTDCLTAVSPLPSKSEHLLKPTWHPVPLQPSFLAENLGPFQRWPIQAFPAPISLVQSFTPPCSGRTAWLMLQQCVRRLIPQGLCIFISGTSLFLCPADPSILQAAPPPGSLCCSPTSPQAGSLPPWWVHSPI